MINIQFKKVQEIVSDGNQITIDCYELSPFRILMMGASGTGKTTLLACMYEDFINKKFEKFSFASNDGIDEGKTRKKLDNQLKQLLKKVKSLEHGEQYTDDRQQIAPSASSQQYFFQGIKSKPATFHHKEFWYPVIFQDIPGEWYTDYDEQNEAELTKKVESADAYMYCIDTPALMSGEYTHKKFNDASRIHSWLVTAARNELLKNKSIIFILSRSEKWREDENRIIREFEEKYSNTIDLLRTAGATVYVTPVYSLGGVQFVKYNENEYPVYEKTGDRKSGKCSDPLIQMLHDGMAMYEKKLQRINRKTKIKIFNKLGITHFDIAEECARELKDMMNCLRNKNIVVHSRNPAKK